MIDISMGSEFYIIKCNDSWWQLRLVFNKECFATSTSLPGLITVLEKALQRYITPEDLHLAWRKSDIRKASEQELERQTKIYNKQGGEYAEHITNTISRINGNSINKRLTAKKKKVITPKATNLVPPKTEVITTPKTIKPLVATIKKRKKIIKK